MASLEIAEKETDKDKVERYQKDLAIIAKEGPDKMRSICNPGMKKEYHNINKHQKRINGHCKSMDISKVLDENIRGMRIAHGHENMQTAVLLDISQCEEKLVESHDKREAVNANKEAPGSYRSRLGMNHQSLSRHHTKPDVCTLLSLIDNSNLHIVEHDNETDCCRQQFHIEHVEKLDDKDVTDGARKNSDIAWEKPYDEVFVSTDAELVAELESLTIEICEYKDAMKSQLRGESNHLNSSKKQAGLRSKYQTIAQRISQINKELSTRTSTQELEVTEKKSVESDKANEFPQDEVDAAVSEDANISQVPGTSSGVQQPIGTATNTSEVHYPMEKLLKYFTSSLQQQDWDGLRYEMQSHIPRYVLCSLQNGNEFFQELVHRNLISDQDMKLLRDAFFQIERVDCVHYIDLAKESQSLLELEKKIQGQTVSDASGEIFNKRVTAVQQNRSITDETDHSAVATGVQITSEVVKDSRENFAGETMQSQEEKLRRENNAVRRSNKGAQQGHQTGAQGDYENPSSISQKSFSGPVQEAAAMCPNPLQPRSNEIRSQSRKEGPQESFDADKYSDYHLATRRTRASQLDEQVQHHGECSNDGITPNEPNHARSRQDEILMTGIYKTGSHKTGSCGSEKVNAGSCVTNNASNANALSAKNGSQDAVKLKNQNSVVESIQTGSCKGEIILCASSNSGNFQLKGRRKKMRNGKWSKPLKFSCEHYDRYCDVQFGCCKEFWSCHRCHNSNSKCEEKKWRSRDIKKIRCKRCSTVQGVSSSLYCY